MGLLKLYAHMAAMFGISRQEEKARFAITSGAAYGRTKSTLLSRDYRSRNKFSPGNRKNFTKGQLAALAAANK